MDAMLIACNVGRQEASAQHEMQALQGSCFTPLHLSSAESVLPKRLARRLLAQLLPEIGSQARNKDKACPEQPLQSLLSMQVPSFSKTRYSFAA